MMNTRTSSRNHIRGRVSFFTSQLTCLLVVLVGSLLLLIGAGSVTWRSPKILEDPDVDLAPTHNASLRNGGRYVGLTTSSSRRQDETSEGGTNGDSLDGSTEMVNPLMERSTTLISSDTHKPDCTTEMGGLPSTINSRTTSNREPHDSVKLTYSTCWEMLLGEPCLVESQKVVGPMEPPTETVLVLTGRGDSLGVDGDICNENRDLTILFTCDCIWAMTRDEAWGSSSISITIGFLDKDTCHSCVGFYGRNLTSSRITSKILEQTETCFFSNRVDWVVEDPELIQDITNLITETNLIMLGSICILTGFFFLVISCVWKTCRRARRPTIIRHPYSEDATRV